MFDFGNDFMRRVDVETSVRLDDFLRVRMRLVHDNMKMIVACILVEGIERLMFGMPPFPREKD